jgi:hypothetical protein
VTPEMMSLNAKLQQKKSALRKDLCERGILPKQGFNSFDKYKYFSELQYKELFTELFTKHGLELTASEVDSSMFVGSEKQPNGRQVKIMFTLTDTETGFSESSVTSGEGMDKGDKGIYKAQTGALKYYLSVTFMVATGDDPERESPEEKTAPTCARCGREIKPTVARDGSTMTVNDIIDYSRRKFKMTLCTDCMAKEVTK